MPASLWNVREGELQGSPSVALRGFSHQDRRLILPALDRAVNSCGCWVVEQRNLSSTQIELVLEVRLSAVFELYGALIAAGVELTRASHAALTGLCTLRRHHALAGAAPLFHGRILTLELEVSFLAEEDEAALALAAAGLA